MRNAMLLVFLSALAFAQIAAGQAEGLSGTASRTLALTPDEVTFSLGVVTEAGTTPEQVATMLKDTGITARDLINISSYPVYSGAPGRPPATQVTYSYTTVIPYSEMRAMIDKLDAARRSIITSNSDLQYGLVVGASESAVEQTRQRLLPELLVEARKNAEFLAKSAQMTLGGIQTVSDTVYPAAAPPVPMAQGYYGGPVGPGGRIYSIRVTYTVFGRWAAKAQ